MTHLSSRQIREMSGDERLRRLTELRDEMLQLQAQRAMGGATSNYGDYKATQRSIARLLTILHEAEKEE